MGCRSNKGDVRVKPAPRRNSSSRGRQPTESEKRIFGRKPAQRRHGTGADVALSGNAVKDSLWHESWPYKHEVLASESLVMRPDPLAYALCS